MAYLTCSTSNEAFAKLTQALGIPGDTIYANLQMDAGDLVTLTITRALTEAEIEAAAEALAESDLEAIPTGTISYNFQPRSEVTEEAGGTPDQ